MEDFEAYESIDEETLAQRLDAWFSRHCVSHDPRLHSILGDHQLFNERDRDVKKFLMLTAGR